MKLCIQSVEDTVSAGWRTARISRARTLLRCGASRQRAVAAGATDMLQGAIAERRPMMSRSLRVSLLLVALSALPAAGMGGGSLSVGHALCGSHSHLTGQFDHLNGSDWLGPSGSL